MSELAEAFVFTEPKGAAKKVPTVSDMIRLLVDELPEELAIEKMAAKATIDSGKLPGKELEKRTGEYKLLCSRLDEFKVIVIESKNICPFLTRSIDWETDDDGLLLKIITGRCSNLINTRKLLARSVNTGYLSYEESCAALRTTSDMSEARKHATVILGHRFVIEQLEGIDREIEAYKTLSKWYHFAYKECQTGKITADLPKK